jgi:DNA-binding transcriptional ArsR family regulator
VDAVSQALADPSRRKILLLLRDQPANAGALAAQFTVSRPAVSRHLRVLREARLVQDSVHGREREYRLDLAALGELEKFLLDLRRCTPWQQRLDALETEVQRVKRRRRTDTGTTNKESA